MGEMADYYLELEMNANPEGWFHCRPHRDSYGPPLTCKRCGSGDVYWQNVKGEHKLYDKNTLEPHDCNKRNMTTEGFDDVV